MSQAFCIHADDNVATMLADTAAGSWVEFVGSNSNRVTAREPVAMGHKIALRPIAAGEPILKFGVPIGRATGNIEPGDWVHLHNIASEFDERSKTLDVQTGAVTDTKYE